MRRRAHILSTSLMGSTDERSGRPELRYHLTDDRAPGWRLRDMSCIFTGLFPTSSPGGRMPNAAVLTTYGPPNVLEWTDVPMPEPSERQVRIRVRVSGV